MVMLGGILNCERDLQRENPKYEILVSRGGRKSGHLHILNEGGRNHLPERKEKTISCPSS